MNSSGCLLSLYFASDVEIGFGMATMEDSNWELKMKLVLRMEVVLVNISKARLKRRFVTA